MQFFKEILIITIYVVIGTCVIVYIFQRSLIYFPSKTRPDPKLYNAADMQTVSIVTQDKLHLSAWYKAALPNKPTILYLHGNAGHIGLRMPLVREFINHGMGVLLVEYRGYGSNPGAPSEKGLYYDTEAALSYLINKNISTKQIVLYGESLGTALAIHLAKENRFCSVILQSPFTSLYAVSRFHYPLIFISPWDKYNNTDKIKRIRDPLLIIHGTNDDIVPLEQAQSLYSHANEPKKFVILKGYGHNNLWDSPHFSYKIIQFIKENCM